LTTLSWLLPSAARRGSIATKQLKRVYRYEFILFRASILTGKYTHNHHTYENSVGKGCNGPSWRQENEKKTIGPYLSAAGYTTGFFG